MMSRVQSILRTVILSQGRIRRSKTHFSSFEVKFNESSPSVKGDLLEYLKRKTSVPIAKTSVLYPKENILNGN